MTQSAEVCTAIVFDLDGTLIDSAPDIAAAVNKAMAGMGQPPLSIDYVEGFIGDGSRSMLHRIFNDRGIDHDDAFLDVKLADYFNHYRAEPATRTRFYPSVREDLHLLADAEFHLGICTNKPHALAELVLEALEIRDLFGSVFGADAVERRKPHQDHLLAVVSDLGADPAHCYYVGDTEIDRACAHSAGIPFFLVNWGGGTNLAAGSDQRIDRLSDLIDHSRLKSGAEQ